MSLIAFKNSQKSAEGITHLNNAGMTPMLAEAREAADAVNAKQQRYGAARVVEFFEDYEQSKTALASFLNLTREGLAWVPNVATAMTQVAFGLDFKPQDEVIVIDQEYPSSIYAWMAVAKQKNLLLTTLHSRPDYSFDFDRLLGAISSRTRVVSLSWVQYQTGTTAPLAKIADACQRVGALFVVDAIQGLGVMPLDFTACGIDVVCAGGHKWLCGPAGLGFLAVKPEKIGDIAPVIHGAATYGQIGDPINQSLTTHANALRFESGCPQTANAAAFAAACQVLQGIGMNTIHQEALRLATKLSEGLKSLGYEVLRRSDSESPITTFRTSTRTLNMDELQQRLQENEISYVPRAEGIRLAPHAFNTDDDIERTLDCLTSSFARSP